MTRAFNSRILIALALAFAASACSLEQTREGEAPEVEVRGGQLPAYEVDTAMVEIGTERTEVEVPDVDVSVMSEEREVEVPSVMVEMPD